MDTAQDQGEDIPNKNMNESPSKAQKNPIGVLTRHNTLIRHIQTQSEKKNDCPAPLIWIIHSAYL